MKNRKVFRRLHDVFASRTDVYAECYYNKKDKRYAYKSVKEKYTIDVLHDHVTNPKCQGIGIYPLLEGNKTKWISADFDYHSEEDRSEAELALNTMKVVAEEIGLNYYIEISKSGNGIHVWIFFDTEIESWKARRLMGGFLLACKADQLSSMDRFFPSQDRLYETSKGYGNLIHHPFSAKFIKHGTYFQCGKSKYTNSIEDIELFLDELETHGAEFVDAILDKWGMLTTVESSAVYEHDNIEYEYAKDGITSVLSDPFIKWCQENPSQVDYNAWIAMITNLIPFGEDGAKAVHNISSLDPSRYDRDATTRKIVACQGMTPITYNWIQKNTNFSEDVDAPYKSPAVAGIKTSSAMSPVYESRGRYYIRSGKKSKELSSFVIEPTKIVKIEDTISRVWNIVAEDKIIKDVAFDANDISSLPAFKRKIMSLYHKLLWYGTEVELMRVLDYLNQHYPKLPSVSGKSSIGMIRDSHSKNWLVLTQLLCWGKDKVYDSYIYFNPSVKKEIIFSDCSVITKGELTEMRKYMFSFNELAVCGSILGWMSSIFVKQRLYEFHSVRFPVLMIHGQAGSGKSETARHVIQPFFGDISPMLRVDDITSFAFTALGSSTNMFPLIYDEYKPALFDNSKIKMVSKMIRGLYDNESSIRGQKDLTTREFKVFAPAVVIGEMGFEETALRERSADVFVNKVEGSKFLDNFIAFSKLPITRFGNSLLNYSLSLSDELIFSLFKANVKGNGRVQHNIAMINTGLDLISMFFDKHGVKLPVDVLKSEVHAFQMEAMTVSGETRSAVDNILEGIMIMKQSHIVGKDKIDANHEGTEMYIHTPTVYPVFKKWARETGFDGEVISHGEFVKQLQKMSYYIGRKNVRIGDADNKDVKKCRVLDIQKLEEKEILE
jgi:hypothetical protein